MARVSLEDRSRQFVEAAAHVIAREGATAATTRRIAAEAGAPLAALHYCFRSKDELLDAVYDHLSRDYVRALEPLEEGLGLATTVRRHVRRIWRRMMAQPHEQVTTIELLLRVQRMRTPEESENALQINRRMYDGWISSTTRIFSEAAAREGIEPVVPFEEVARFTVAGIDGISLQHLADPDEERYTALVERLGEVLIAMITGRIAPAEDAVG
jgi:AcrR family transcriptional regulator